MKSQPDRLTQPWTAPLWLSLAVSVALSAIALLACAGAAWADTPQQPVGASRLDGYIAAVATAWEPYTTADGRVLDPLDASDTGDNYGVIMLADVMLKLAERSGDRALEADGESILRSAIALPVPSDPFNLLAIASVIHDGQAGDFPTGAWEALSAPLAQRAGQIGFPTQNTCLITPGCYDNWRLVWAAGAALLLSEDVAGVPGSLAGERALTTTQIRANLELALISGGTPIQTAVAKVAAPRRGANHTGQLMGSTPLGTARELSDPGSEPSAYELFSTFMLELIAEADPQAITPALERLRRQADRYALYTMAPDGQLSLSGRSLDQSWVQAAGAALGARRAALEPAQADLWHSYSDRAASYLLSAYPIRPDGLLAIVPGLNLEWNRSIVDGYAALNQYEGLTLWLLSDALAEWPRTLAPRAPLPGDGQNLLVQDLASSGLLWGRSGRVWWELSGRATGEDPRSAQGLVAVKLEGPDGWHDLLALRPRRARLSSAWRLRTAQGRNATPVFTAVRGDGGHVVLKGEYMRANGRPLARATWTLDTISSGVRLRMSVPAKAMLHTTVWLPNARSRRLSAHGAQAKWGACVVSASGRACPTTIYWRGKRAAVLEVSP